MSEINPLFPTYYVGKGRVTSHETAEAWGVPLGSIEWQFSDAPLGQRTISYDFPTYEAGVKALSPCNIIQEHDEA